MRPTTGRFWPRSTGISAIGPRAGPPPKWSGRRKIRALGTLSYVSPVAQAMLGKQVGDVVEAGTAEATIVKIA